MNRKEFVLNAVSRKQDLVVEVSDRIFDFAETGFHEFETAKLYQQVLEKEGFAVEMGIAGMPTAFKATYGNGKPVVASGAFPGGRLYREKASLRGKSRRPWLRPQPFRRGDPGCSPGSEGIPGGESGEGDRDPFWMSQ